ncbi:MAG: type II toxin-antitoxin system RelE/ParE family toxin [Phycisphaerae bacterium]|nr:type II toxin-antitoxin system RelE/ParE family toxin [Phycisphaerales bacterium]
MTRYRLTPQARSDLLDITDYMLEQASPERAGYVIAIIREAIEKLADMPGLGHKREDLTTEDVRFWNVFKYYIVYRPETIPLEVVAIISGWRDVPNELTGRIDD